MWQQTQVQFNRSLWKNDHTFGFTARLSFMSLIQHDANLRKIQF